MKEIKCGTVASSAVLGILATPKISYVDLTVLTVFSSYVAILEKSTSLEETLCCQTLPCSNDGG